MKGTFAETCSLENQNSINTEFLPAFGNGLTPVINLDGYSSANRCTGLSSDIKTCEAKGITVMFLLEEMLGARN